MPRFHPDSDSDDYVPRHHHRSPHRRSSTPGPRPIRDPSPGDGRHPRFEFEPHTPFYPAVPSGGASPSPHRRSRSAGPTNYTPITTDDDDDDAATTMPPDSTILTRHRLARDHDRDRDRARDRARSSDRAPRRHRSRSSSSCSSCSYSTDSDDDRHHPSARDRRDRRDHGHGHGRRSTSHPHPHSPLYNKAQALLASTFTPSTSGLGVGVLGAIVGGLAAREASEAIAGKDRDRDARASSHHGHGHHHGALV
ncbi:hypothetical protein B0I37DRAFT_406041 [Chaetomium sp. MPI-CAGE-AT-0009]|nr:hypothetical protein B0I37DRAFT_406041 [Chaetomium sp. MPI-CAGE-AT-0009]